MEMNLNKVKADREFFDGLGNIYPADATVEITRESIAGVTCYWFVPQTSDAGRIILYLHGGMFGLGSITSHRPMVSYFASSLATKVVFVEYALAPEKPFPAGSLDVQRVYEELIRKYPNVKFTLIGDSAGGGLSVSLVSALSEKNLPAPSNVVLISPWLYLKCDTGSHESRKKIDSILTKDKLLEYANYYAANHQSEADPGQLHFNSFPPLFILVGSNEILFDDSKFFYRKIKPLQSCTEMKEYMDQGHVWLIADIQSGSSRNALADIKAFIAKTTIL